MRHGWVLLLYLTGCQVVTGLNELDVEQAKTAEPTETSNRDGGTDSDVSSDDTTRPAGDASVDGGCKPPGDTACTPGDNCGCDEEETCALVDSADGVELLCVNPGQLGLEDACDDAEACGFGLLCINELCVQACRADDDCQSGRCQTMTDADGETIPEVRYCITANAECDLVSPHAPGDGKIACKSGETCVHSQQSTSCVDASGEGRQGDACRDASACAPGFACDDGSCKQWCDPEQAQCADARSTCEPSTTEGDEALGVCEPRCDVPDVDGSECGVFPDCGCGAEETCRVMDASGRTGCSPVGETDGQAACASDEDCRGGHACVGGLCRPYCEAGESTCGDDGACVPLLDGDEAVQGVNTCLGHCDPVTPSREQDGFTPCGDDAYCAVGVAATELEASYCVAAAPREQRVSMGEACTDMSECPNGTMCAARCMPWCRSATDCDGLTAEPVCYAEFGADLVFQAESGDELGLCCTPTPTPGSECSTLEGGCGCPSGEACHVTDVEAGTTECLPAGEVGRQSACEYHEDCQAGSSCIGNLCRPLCEGDRCGSGEGSCFNVVYDGQNGDLVPVPHSRACSGHCDPVDPTRDDEQFTPCGEGARCLPGEEGVESFDISHCVVATYDLEPGQECYYDDDCRDGYGCVGYACVAWCRTDADCNAGTCNTVDYRRPVAENDWLGFCEPDELLPIDPLD